MNKRKSDASPTLPRKKAKLDQPTDTPILQISNVNTASSSSSPATSSPTTPRRREKRKRIDDSAPIDRLDEESNTSISTKRAKTQSPANSTRHSRSPSFEPWPSHDDDPQSQAHIYYEDEYYTKELTKRARRFRRAATLALNGYLKCSCGKYHYMDGRNGYHYGDGEPELERPAEAREQPESVSVYQNRGRDPLLSPELSDGEADAGDDQLEIPPVDVSIPQAPLTISDSPVPIVPETSTVLPTTSPTASPTTNKARVSRQRNNAKRNTETSNLQRQTRRKNTRNMEKEKENKDNASRRQPRNRKSKTTSAAEEPVHSRRSSRRDTGSQLWFLGDNGEACLVVASSR